jgi:hypothetical protein
VTSRYDHAAEVLRQQEFSRLSADTVPTLESLRFLNPTQLRARVADMLERLGYELLTPETARDMQATKEGRKYVVTFASTMDPLPTQANHLTRLHQAINATNAAGGFYVTTRGFSRDAEAYAATAPIRLVNGPKLVASIKRSMESTPAPDSYKAMCRQCGEIVMIPDPPAEPPDETALAYLDYASEAVTRQIATALVDTKKLPTFFLLPPPPRPYDLQLIQSFIASTTGHGFPKSDALLTSSHASNCT